MIFEIEDGTRASTIEEYSSISGGKNAPPRSRNDPERPVVAWQALSVANNSLRLLIECCELPVPAFKEEEHAERNGHDEETMRNLTDEVNSTGML
jgi:hypothetical protein